MTSPANTLHANFSMITTRRLVTRALVALGAWTLTGCKAASEGAVKLPDPAFDAPPPASAAMQTAVFAGGCFWGVQAVFQHTQGVMSAVSGYAGGKAEHADYASVSTGATGHAEAVQITYDPKQISYARLLQVFFSVAHDPTQLDRQGPDAGTQYRSAIFYQDAQQKDVAARYIAQLEAAKVFADKIVTQLTPLTAFFPAEPEHQDYATLNPHSPYIAQFDRPKIVALKALMPQVYREQPVLVSARK